MPIDFSNSTFHERADFSGVQFNGAADFRKATFNGNAYFSNAIFNEKVCFLRATFNEKAHFRATFKRANFIRATFNGNAYFSNAIFNEAVTFKEATFNKKADFSEAKIGRVAYFPHAVFNEVKFVDLKRGKKGILSTDGPVLIFRGATFNDPENTRFDQLDLSNISFVAADVSQIDIGENVRWDANKKFLDERLAERGEVSYEKAGTVYRRLRQNLESKLRYAEAGKFFIAEMEVKRKNIRTKNKALKWLRTNILSVLAWYKYFCNYGEDHQRAILWVLLTPLVAALLATLFMTPLPYTRGFLMDFQDYINHFNQFFINFQSFYRDYLFAFFQLKSDNFVELGLRIFSLLLMGQLYLAMRRQFERRSKGTSFA
jgi:uncharacterized protein YjbI with pentapeptide repeats